MSFETEMRKICLEFWFSLDRFETFGRFIKKKKKKKVWMFDFQLFLMMHV